MFISRETIMQVFQDLKLKEEKGDKFVVDERRMLEIIKRMGRCCRIMKVRISKFYTSNSDLH